MTKINRAAALALTGWTTLAAAAPSETPNPHAGHAKHNMLLFGGERLYASHLVYKQPHNYQVILEVELDAPAKRAFQDAKKKFPDNTFVLLLDHMVIQNIRDLDSISGTLQRLDQKGQRQTILDRVVLPKQKFKVIYLDELPLSLAADGFNG